MKTEHQKACEAFAVRAGFRFGWENLESSARRMVEHAVDELAALAQERATQHAAGEAELLTMVIDDLDTCLGELGSDYEFKELSTETIEALGAYRRLPSVISLPSPAFSEDEMEMRYWAARAGIRDEAEASGIETPATIDRAAQGGRDGALSAQGKPAGGVGE